MLTVNYKDRNGVNEVVLVSLLLTLNVFHTSFFCDSFVDFQEVNVYWDIYH